MVRVSNFTPIVQFSIIWQQFNYNITCTETKITKDRPQVKPTVGEGHEEGELCSDSSIDTIFQANQETYAFKGKNQN